ncbi:MAG: cytochrome b/b6 domain-containing protein [Methylotenera sp.]|jgi:cytochrome b|nr:cytochrome b/b6 domain-containing protein [Methylotenera sp.]HQM87712.1 cytochrome b/b6 domain-containing protein [Methylotenera sp.]
MQPEIQPSKTFTWSLLVRLTHWLVALCVIINFFNDTGYWHRIIGYACFVVVLVRLGNGLWISKHTASRFHLPSFTVIKNHLNALRFGTTSSHIGHNPLGQLAVYCMWLLILLLVFTGWLSRTDLFWGEDWPVDIHTTLSNILQAMVVLHLLAVILMSKLQHKNLIKAILIDK